ncbi:hypothetical protein FSP39_014452 [Pinctada imbricata]|uniref:Globin domain-containing protein n=1 Tax=Pinctada imbricata TaxID=66713 RepID=A0AA89BT30_PINIB|nr:hypothetical protein FSP39_014452 [Pinctada imbricata]
MGCQITCGKKQEPPALDKEVQSSEVPTMNIAREKFTDEQKEIVRETWNIVREDIAKIGVVTFLRLFEKNPDLKDLFVPFRGMDMNQLRQHEGLREHGLRVMGSIEKCVARIDSPRRFDAMLTELGHKHVVFNIKPDYFELLGPQLITAIKPAIGEKWTPEVEEAWMNFYHLIVYTMRVAMVS